MMENLWSDIVPTWLTAIGTVSAVIVAIFGRVIREKCCEPKIVIEYNHKNNACCEIIDMETESSSNSKSIKIRIKLNNNGINTANNATLNIDSYLTKRNDDVYVTKNFTPKILQDHRGINPNKIVPNLNYYYEIAVIQKTDVMKNRDEKGNSKQFYKLFLLGEGKTIELGLGTFIIPLKFYSSKTKIKIGYLSIYWESDTFTTEPLKFSVKMLSEKEFKKITIE